MQLATSNYSPQILKPKGVSSQTELTSTIALDLLIA
jgi:hypothetical protein